MAEVGVYRGDFAAEMLRRCECLTTYYMIDPWRHLDNWNKPANQSDTLFEEFLQEVKIKTEFAAGKRHILRGKTAEVINQIPDGELDFAYIDGDHTLRGITIDLIHAYPKIRPGGYLGGDDFSRSVFQHERTFEPTLVFPFAVYFAEAVGASIYALPYSQFCLRKNKEAQFSFFDLTGTYGEVGLRDQFTTVNFLKITMRDRFRPLARAVKKAKGSFLK
jgi:hypothetical protein